MKTRYQVFVSSTYEDLKVQRESVIKALLELGHIPVGMEMFSAGDEQQWELIKRQIDDSDYYVVILAHRYGSLDGHLSYTEKEYDYALSKSIPVLGFIIQPTADWPAHLIDDDIDARSALDKFKLKVKSKVVSFWSNSEDLHARVSISIAKAVTAYPRVGWVRATASVSPELTNELSRLSRENAELRADLKKFLRHDEQAILDDEAATMATLKDNAVIVNLKFRGESKFVNPVETNLYEIFSIVAQELVIEIGVHRFITYLSFFLRSKTYKEATLDAKFPIAVNQAKNLLGSFQALGLFEPSSKRHKVGDPEEYWQVTEKGRKLHLALTRKQLERNALKARETPDSISADSGVTGDFNLKGSLSPERVTI